jgi:predicted DNA-binding transcriptional regulator YafY
MTAGDLAARLDVSERTIYRDLDALSTAGVPVTTERGPGGGVALPERYRIDLTALHRDEASALFLSAVPGPLTALGAGPPLDAALRKLSAALPAAVQRAAELARQRVHLDPADWWRPPEPVPHLRLIQEGVWQSQRLRVTYARPGGAAVVRRVDPYGLVAKASIWYLVAGTVPDGPEPAAGGPPRVFRVARVRAAELLAEPAHRPDGFDLAAFWAAWCEAFERERPSYPVLVRIQRALLPVLPRVFGEGIRAVLAAHGRPDADGAVVLPLTFENEAVACGRLLGLGPLAEVLAPCALRERVIQHATAIAAVYRADTPHTPPGDAIGSRGRASRTGPRTRVTTNRSPTSR